MFDRIGKRKERLGEEAIRKTKAIIGFQYFPGDITRLNGNDAALLSLKYFLPLILRIIK